MKKILSILITASIMLTGCGNTPKVEDDLYTIMLRSMATELQGSVPSEEDFSAMNAAELTEYLESVLLTYGDSLDSDSLQQLNDLFGTNTPTPINNETYADEDIILLPEYKPIDTSNGIITLVNLPQKEEFISQIRLLGTSAYIKKINPQDLPLVKLEKPDWSLMENAAARWTITDVISLYPNNVKQSNDMTVSFKPENVNGYYNLTSRKGIQYATFYPTITVDGQAVFMDTLEETTNTPLWTVYFAYYMKELEERFKVSVSKGIINQVNNGLEMWWAPDTGCTLQLSIYASGMIKITYSTDNRVDEYVKQLDAEQKAETGNTIGDTIFANLNMEYGIVQEAFASLKTIIDIFELPCGKINLYAPGDTLTTEDLNQWRQAASIYGNYLVGFTAVDIDNLTAYEASIQLLNFCLIGREGDNDILNCKNLISALKDDESLIKHKSEQMMNIYKEYTNELLQACKSVSFFNIQDYNSTSTVLIYIPVENTDINVVIAEKVETFAEKNATTYELVKTVALPYLKIPGLDGIINNPEGVPESETDKAKALISNIESAPLTETSTVFDFLNRVRVWAGLGKSEITIVNLNNIVIESTDEAFLLKPQDEFEKIDLSKPTTIMKEILSFIGGDTSAAESILQTYLTGNKADATTSTAGMW